MSFAAWFKGAVDCVPLQSPEVAYLLETLARNRTLWHYVYNGSTPGRSTHFRLLADEFRGTYWGRRFSELYGVVNTSGSSEAQRMFRQDLGLRPGQTLEDLL